MTFSNDKCRQIEERFYNKVDRKRELRVMRVKGKARVNEGKGKVNYRGGSKYEDSSYEQFDTVSTQVGQIGFRGRQSLEIESRTDHASKSYRGLTSWRIRIEKERTQCEEQREERLRWVAQYWQDREDEDKLYYERLYRKREEQSRKDEADALRRDQHRYFVSIGI